MFPYFTIEGRRFTNYRHARALAMRFALEYQRDIPIMEKLDEYTASYVLETIRPFDAELYISLPYTLSN